MIKLLFRSPYFKFIIGFLYAYCFYKGYILFLSELFEYAGYAIIRGRLDNLFLKLFSFFASIFPLFFFTGVKKISSLLCVFIYFLLYVPIIVTYYFNMIGSDLFVIYQQILFLVSMSLLFCADKISSNKGIGIPLKLRTEKVILVTTLVLVLVILFAYRNNLRLVSFSDVYIQRFENRQYNTNFVIAYSVVWVSNVLLPFSIAYGIFSKKKIYILLGALSAVIVYMATAAKSTILYPALILVVYLVLKKRNLVFAFNYIGIGFLAIMIISLQFGMNVVTSLIWMRTIGNGGMLARHYWEFFQTHPRTYYSHINVVNAVTNGYPYSKSLGEVIASNFWNDFNANAAFWSTDGYAALGDFGILFSSGLLFMVFVLFNKVSNGYHLLFIILSLIPYITSVTNTSLFTSLVTGGGLGILMLLALKDTRSNRMLQTNLKL